MTISSGNEGCPCINITTTLSSLTDRSCTTSDNQTGILLTPRSESCVPHSYGSSECLEHDLLHDPACNIAHTDITESNLPSYCIRTWCYVDMESCTRYSEDRVFRSEYFAEEEVFFSYNTCGNSAEDWLVHENTMGGISIKAIVPVYNVPMLYKTTEEGEILASPGEEYYNNSVPFKGVYMNYINNILRVTDGDIKEISFTHRSKANGNLHPTSSYTAAVQDIEDGIADMAIGPFWITAQRLRMTAFTVPLLYDKTVLVIPKPGEKTSLLAQAVKVSDPFTPGLWGLVISIIIFTALLSVWFSDNSNSPPKPALRKSLAHRFHHFRSQSHKRRFRSHAQKRYRKRKRDFYARKSLDAILEKGMFFFSAGVEQDNRASLPHKLLMFGFGFFILISVSAYVANLAAFLTRSIPDHVGTMEEAVQYGLKICGHPALKDDLESKWPSVTFIYSDTAKDFYGLVDDYDAGKCDVMAVGREDTTMDFDLLNLFCERGLVFTESVVIENPIAFPIKAELAPSFSYWMLEGEKYHGVTLENAKMKYNELNKRELTCSVEISELGEEASDYTSISPLNMSFPIMFWGAFSVIATTVQIVHVCQRRKGRSSRVLGNIDFGKSYYKKANKATMDDKNDSDDEDAKASNSPIERPLRIEDTFYDCESQLKSSLRTSGPISGLDDHTESKNDSVDNFNGNGSAHNNDNSIVASFSSREDSQRRKSVTFAIVPDLNQILFDSKEDESDATKDFRKNKRSEVSPLFAGKF